MVSKGLFAAIHSYDMYVLVLGNRMGRSAPMADRPQSGYSIGRLNELS